MIKKSAHLLSLLLFVVVFAGKANAAQIETGSVTLGDSRPSVVNAHTIQFNHPTAATLESIRIRYCTTPSGTCTKPAGLTTTTAVKGTITGLTGGSWTLTATTDGTLDLVNAIGEAVSGDATLSLGFTTITNHAIDDCEVGGQTSSDTCYVRINTYTDEAFTTLSDEGILSYTVIAAVTVSARVDPSFTFVVAPVNSAVTNNGITTSVNSTFGTLPFGNLTPGTPKYAAHSLTVTTNTVGGYTVTARMAQQMTGVYAGNEIDPFTSAWTAPAVWAAPTGTTPNTNTGWFGANTTDTDVANWSGVTTGLFGGVGPTAVQVMRATTSDDGSTPVVVSYAIEVNVFQPADTYAGRLQYNAVATY